MTFEKWIEELRAIAARHYGEKCASNLLQNPDAWLGYYEDGYAPSNALNEELSYE